MSAYLDTTVLIPTLIAEPSTEAVFDWIGATNRELLVSDFAAAEVAAALSRLVRMGRLASADAFARLADFDVWRAAMSSPVDIRSADARSLIFLPGPSSRHCVRRMPCTSRYPDASMQL